MSEMDSREILRHLIGFPTVSRESNLALVEFIQDYLVERGVESTRFYNEARTKANLFATIGPHDKSGVVLSGHTDVVPADGQPWTVGPFAMTEKEGRFYGRGAADMKGFIASVLAAVPAFLETPLAIPVHLAFSYDEEVGCLGVRSMLADLQKRPLKPWMCIIGEPTGMKPVLGHKGKLAMRCKVKGAPCHSAYAPRGVNAIEYAAKLIGHLNDIGFELAMPEHKDPRFDPPFSTVQTGVIQGGRALNIVPAECEFDFEIRALPDVNASEIVARLKRFAACELIPRMHAVQPDTGIDFSELSAYPGLATHPDSEAARWLAMLSGSNQFGTVAFGTEGGLFNQSGIPTVVCGPGNMDQGHKPDEYVSAEQMASCDAMLQKLAVHLRAA